MYGELIKDFVFHCCCLFVKGFFHKTPVDNLSAEIEFVDHLKTSIGEEFEVRFKQIISVSNGRSPILIFVVSTFTVSLNALVLFSRSDLSLCAPPLSLSVSKRPLSLKTASLCARSLSLSLSLSNAGDFVYLLYQYQTANANGGGVARRRRRHASSICG